MSTSDTPPTAPPPPSPQAGENKARQRALFSAAIAVVVVVAIGLAILLVKNKDGDDETATSTSTTSTTKAGSSQSSTTTQPAGNSVTPSDYVVVAATNKAGEKELSLIDAKTGKRAAPFFSAKVPGCDEYGSGTLAHSTVLPDKSVISSLVDYVTETCETHDVLPTFTTNLLRISAEGKETIIAKDIHSFAVSDDGDKAAILRFSGSDLVITELSLGDDEETPLLTIHLPDFALENAYPSATAIYSSDDDRLYVVTRTYPPGSDSAGATENGFVVDVKAASKVDVHTPSACKTDFLLEFTDIVSDNPRAQCTQITEYGPDGVGISSPESPAIVHFGIDAKSGASSDESVITQSEADASDFVRSSLIAISRDGKGTLHSEYKNYSDTTTTVTPEDGFISVIADFGDERTVIDQAPTYDDDAPRFSW